MSNGNVEQPTAQTPRGHNSPNGVEVSEEGRQGAPASNAQGQERSNGQSREAREEQLAATRAGLAARARAAGATSTAQPPGSAPVRSLALPQGPRALRRSAREMNRRNRPRRDRPLHRRPNRDRVRHRRLSRGRSRRRLSATGQRAQQAGAVAAGSASTTTADRRPGSEHFRPGGAS